MPIDPDNSSQVSREVWPWVASLGTFIGGVWAGVRRGNNERNDRLIEAIHYEGDETRKALSQSFRDIHTRLNDIHRDVMGKR